MMRAILPSLLGLLAAGGCVQRTVHVEPRPVQPLPAPPPRVQAPVARAGATFTVRLERTLGSAVSQDGERFTAEVQQPLHDDEGRLLVPRGATLEGQLAEVDGGARPSLKLDFQTIETKDGAPVPVEARVLRADPAEDGAAWDPSAIGHDPSAGHDAIFHAPEGAREILLSRGSELTLQLTRPLSAEGAFPPP